MPTDHPSGSFDAVVIGGSYAGLSAALQLARARRRVAVIDAGSPRNRFAPASHGFLGQDGRKPGDIAATGRAELLAYPTVQWIEGHATDAARLDGGFTVRVGTDRTLRTRSVVLAVGVSDELPAVDGLADRWGKSVFHCPYCHGYELDNGRIGVLGVSPLSHHHAMMLPDWGQVTLFTNGVYAPDDAQVRELAERGVVIEPVRVARIVDTATVVLDDGRRLRMDGLFTLSHTRVTTAIPGQLGCAFDEGPTGAFIRTDATKATTVPGVFACGDAARANGNVAMAVGDGAQAGFSAHRSLIFAAHQ